MRVENLLRAVMVLPILGAPAYAQTGPTTVYVQTQPGQSGAAPGASQGLGQVPSPVFAPEQPSITLPTPAGPRNQVQTVDDVMTLGRPSSSSVPGQAVRPTSPETDSANPVIDRPAAESSPVAQLDSGVGKTFKGIPSVIDGNTIRIGGATIVLHGADAPESGQTCLDSKSVPWNCGDKASRHLAGLVEDKSLTCTGVEDIPGAVAATCISGNTDFAKAMVRDGYAVVPDYLAPMHSSEQAEARASSRGMWVGSFRKPEQFRTGL